jgi:hypothetical protein
MGRRYTQINQEKSIIRNDNKISVLSPPLVGGDKGEGDAFSIHPHPSLPRREGMGPDGNFNYI